MSFFNVFCQLVVFRLLFFKVRIDGSFDKTDGCACGQIYTGKEIFLKGF